ncbi:hypothetical protein O6H91_10G061700 [Diphasiastrum complanatum]|uniref:Uncharacterized protein n=1 Tax=Diphasiastrum complanatum TaxID=34168 RepID=A0ACC2CHF8_DIPCM|nr:hypothetical protein O6H91_10G061700 [Diphasiastrum complanatum]
MLSFSDKQRFLGTVANAYSTMYLKNTSTQVKRLIGRRFRYPKVQRDLQRFHFSLNEAPDRNPTIDVQYLGKISFFWLTQILGMILSKLTSVAEKSLGTQVVNCGTGIPIYFTVLQQRVYLDVALTVGLHPFWLMHETMASALVYGIYKTYLPQAVPIHVVFVDIGHASMQVYITAFEKGQLKILGQAFDRSLGDWDFDEVLFNQFSAKVLVECEIDILLNVSVNQRLRATCEKLKMYLVLI